MVETKKIKDDVKMETVTEVKAETAEVKNAPKTVIQSKKEKSSREVAIVNGFSLAISTKNSSAIGKMIMKKPIERGIEMLELVLQHKMAVPMPSMEIPHRKRSLMPEAFGGGGRFPANAAKEIIHLLKQLKANCESGNVENPVVTLFVANIASRPFRKDRTRAKRTHIHMEAKDKTKLIIKKK